ncbi:MAG: hypothetical protein R3C14_23790 [Caldilineaceae bacterium]
MKGISLIFILAGVWAFTGIIVGLGLNSLTGGEWIISCGSLNVAIGMILLQLVTRNEAARRLFYEGEKEEDYLSIGVAALWAIPVLLALAGLLWWILGKVLAP